MYWGLHSVEFVVENQQSAMPAEMQTKWIEIWLQYFSMYTIIWNGICVDALPNDVWFPG